MIKTEDAVLQVLNMLNFLEDRGVSREEMYLYYKDDNFITSFGDNGKGWSVGETHNLEEDIT